MELFDFSVIRSGDLILLEPPDMDFFAHLSLIEDPRSHVNRQHNLVDIMFLVMAAVVSGCEGWQEIEDFGTNKLDWLRKYRPFACGIPTRHSIARIIKGVKIEPLVQSLFAWVNARRKAAGQPIIAIDGKTIRGAVNQNGPDNALHLVSAFDTGEGLVLCQQATKNKGGEIEAVRQLIDCLDIKGTIVTMDALHCQKDTLQQLTKSGADFVVQVKENQPKLLEALRTQFQPYWERNGEGLAHHYTQNQGHGRQEERTVFQLAAELPEELRQSWPGIRSLVAVERSRSRNGTGSLDTSYYVSSLEIDPEQAAKAVRQHWQIENQQHWVLDVTYREDVSRLGDREAAEVFALFRRIALNMAQHHPKQMSKRRKIKCSCWNDDFRVEMFFGVATDESSSQQV
jgi:predicted transposase YbfD/YdcC